MAKMEPRGGQEAVKRATFLHLFFDASWDRCPRSFTVGPPGTGNIIAVVGGPTVKGIQGLKPPKAPHRRSRALKMAQEAAKRAPRGV